MTAIDQKLVVTDPSIPDSGQSIVRETRIRVHRTVKLNGRDEDSASEEDTLEVTQFATQPAIVTVSVPIKISRNFQSVGLEVSVSLPCYREELEDGIELAYRIAKDRVAREIPAIQSALQGVIDHHSTPL